MCVCACVLCVCPLRVSSAQAKKVGGKNPSLGIDGINGKIADMSGVFDPYAVKTQTIKTAVEAACMLLRIDEIVSGLSKGKR